MSGPVVRIITRADAMRIAAEAQVDVRTVTRIYEGGTSKGLVRSRVEEAAKKLKMVAPPKAK